MSSGVRETELGKDFSSGDQDPLPREGDLSLQKTLKDVANAKRYVQFRTKEISKKRFFSIQRFEEL